MALVMGLTSQYPYLGIWARTCALPPFASSMHWSGTTMKVPCLPHVQVGLWLIGLAALSENLVSFGSRHGGLVHGTRLYRALLL
jgi:hypothetical protein